MRPANHEAFEKDHRHFLYREYLRILAVHAPPVFILENVRGILSSKIEGQNIFDQILDDLQAPEGPALERMPEMQRRDQPVRYRVYSLNQTSDTRRAGIDPHHFVIEAEKHGVPQNRHRVIILGIREDFLSIPMTLQELKTIPSMWDVLSDLPKLRSGLSKEMDSGNSWLSAVKAILECTWLKHERFDASR
ncbi:MAG: DNA cytosine methyltransferase, partial [Desulforhabdus sp.]|nr:DNA cytosine methyltransferase [Desulforhabdus sp.]